MRTIILLAVMLLISLPNKGYAEPEKQGNTNILGKLYDQYATIAGAWYMNKQCSVLDVDKSKEFEWYVGQINIAMGRLTKNTSALQAIQRSAKNTAESDKYKDCGEDSKKIVLGSFDLAKNMNLALTKQPYDKENSNKSYLIKRFASVALWMTFSNSCKSLPENIGIDVNNVYNKITEKLSKKYPQEIESIKTEIQSTEKDLEKANCSKVKERNTIMLSEIRALEKTLDLK